MDSAPSRARSFNQWIQPLAGPSFIPASVVIPGLAVLGLAAFLLGAYGALGGGQPFPIYAYLGLFFMVIQVTFLQRRPLVLLYAIGTDIVGIFLAGDAVLNPGRRALVTQLPQTFYAIHILVVAVLLIDAVIRFVTRPRGDEAPQRFPYDMLAADFAGPAAVFFLFWAGLTYLGSHSFLFTSATNFHISSTPLHDPYAYVSVPLNLTLGTLHFPYLEDLDIFAFAILAAMALFTALIDVALRVFQQDEQKEPKKQQKPRGVLGGLRAIFEVLYNAGKNVLLAIRLILGPVAWFLAALALASAAQIITSSMAHRTATFADVPHLFLLLWPFNTHANDSGRPGADLTVLLLLAGVILAIGLSVALFRFDRGVLLNLLIRASGAVASAFPIFSWVLALINIALASLTIGQPTLVPFQTDYTILVALLVVVLLAGLEYLGGAVIPKEPPKS
jgi:hypothetical protein